MRVGLFLISFLVGASAHAITRIDTPISFLGGFSFGTASLVVLTIGGGLAAFAALFFAVVRGLMMFGNKVAVPKHGVWDKDVYDAAMLDLQEHWEKGGIMDKESREELGRWQFHNADRW